MPKIARPEGPTVSLTKNPQTSPSQTSPPPTPPRQPFLTATVDVTGGASPRALLVVAVVAVAAMFLMPSGPTGLGITLIGTSALFAVFYGAGRRPTGIGWVAVLGITALLLAGTWRSAQWVTTACLALALVATGVLMIDARTIRQMLFTVVAPIALSARTTRWLYRGARTSRTTHRIDNVGAIIGVAVTTVALVATFTALFAGADATFGSLLDNVVPDLGGVDINAKVVVGLGVGAFVAIGVYAMSARLRFPATAGRVPGPNWMWAIPTGTVLALYVVFLITQTRAMFGGDDYVQQTAGLTYADYARSGFWQLFAVTALTIVVISIAWQRSDRGNPAGRLLVRVILGGLCVAALAVVCSALHRMNLYMDAFGATRLRISVLATELWLGAILVTLIFAGVTLRTRRLARVIGLLTMASALSFALYNPDARIATANVDRYEETGKVDLDYLAHLSPDATAALLTLPTEQRGCALRFIVEALDEDDDLRDFNIGRSRARDALDRHRFTPLPTSSTMAC